MRSIWAARGAAPQDRIDPAVQSFADECGDALRGMLAYTGGLALIAVIVVSAAARFADLAGGAPIEPAAAGQPGWAPGTRSYPAFAVSQLDLPGHTETYDVLRHPAGGRKDVLRWSRPGDRPAAELEIHRPGTEAMSGPAVAELAARMDPDGARRIEPAGVIDSKFGPVTLLRLPDRKAAGCLGFIKRLEQPDLRISGWSCQGETLPAQRAAIGCMLSRLVLLTAGNDPNLADLFARAELRRSACTAAAARPTVSADWVGGPQNPKLRGAI